MKIKRISAMMLAAILCISCFSVTAFAYTEETETTPIEETQTTESEKTISETVEEVPYRFSVDEDGNVTFSFDGEDYTFNTKDLEESKTTWKVVTGGSRLNLRTSADMNYEIIDRDEDDLDFSDEEDNEPVKACRQSSDCLYIGITDYEQFWNGKM